MKIKSKPTGFIAAVAIGLGVCAGTSAFGALSVTTTSSATDLANAILGSGITLNSASYSGAAGASGTFTGGNTVPFGFDRGIVLTTGAASGAGTGVNNSGSYGTDNGASGDAALTTLAGYQTYNAAILTMGFTISPANPGNLYFNFAFASDEYNEYSLSQFNDVFAFYLDGVNIGLLPNGQRVSVNSVNNSVNSQYYHPNRFGDTLGFDGTAGSYHIEYDGLTTVLTASALGIAAGPHSIRLAIADASDGVWDSAVFIQGGTFSTIETPVPEPSTCIAGALLLLPFGASLIRKLRKA
jgi:hypothetical protein